MAATATTTATAEPKAKAPWEDVLLTIEDKTMPLSELIAKTSERAVGSSWARGDIELGRRVKVVTGNPNITLTREGESPARLVVEDGFEWSGPKTSRHQPLSEILAERLPKCANYRKYRREKNDQGEEYSKPVSIDREEAIKLCEYQVRLTDKGLAALSGE